MDYAVDYYKVDGIPWRASEGRPYGDVVGNDPVHFVVVSFRAAEESY